MRSRSGSILVSILFLILVLASLRILGKSEGESIAAYQTQQKRTLHKITQNGRTWVAEGNIREEFLPDGVRFMDHATHSEVFLTGNISVEEIPWKDSQENPRNRGSK